jgi:hypothetical protein
MRLELVQELLQLISDLERAATPEGAAVSWLPIMDGVDFQDARAAILDHYGSSAARDRQGQARRILPHDVRSGALYHRDRRLLAARRALPPPVARRPDERPPEVEREVEEARRLIADARAKHQAKLTGVAA